MRLISGSACYMFVDLFGTQSKREWGGNLLTEAGDGWRK